MIYSSCEAPNECDCIDCEYELIKRNKMRIVENKDGFYKKVKNSFDTNHKKSQPNISDTVPKMYYNEQELYEYNIIANNSIIELYFNNSSLVSPILVEDSIPEPTMQISLLRYEKVHLRNCRYSVLYVMSDLMKQFKEIYFVKGEN